MKTTHAPQGYTSERGSIPMNKWKPPIPRTRVTYEQKTSISLCVHSHQLIETSRPDELRSGWGQHELTDWARWGWERLPSAWELRVRKHIHVCIPLTPCKFMHPDRLTELNSPLLEEFRESETVYLCHFGQDTALCACISWGQMFRQAQSGNPAAAGQVVIILWGGTVY